MFSNSNCASVPLVANVGGNGNGNGWNGDGAWLIWIVLIFALFGFGGFGFGGFGGGGGALQGYTTQADIQRGFDTSNIVSKLDGITNGLSDGFYAMNASITNGFNTTNITIMQMQNALQALISQCCCETREAIQNVNYNLATQACDIKNTVQNTARDIIDNANANNRAILDFLVNDKIATLTAENQNLKFQASQTAQNAFITANQEAQTAELIRRINPMPVPAFTVPAPYAYAGCGCNTGCGC